MKIAYATDFDLNAVKTGNLPKKLFGHWGHCYYIANSLEDEHTIVHPLGPLTKKTTLLPKVKSRFYRYFSGKIYQPWAEPVFNKDYAAQISKKLSFQKADIVATSDGNLIAYLDCPQPIVLWTDTIYAGLIDFYPDFNNLCNETIQQMKTLDKLALNNCELAIFASEWAAKVAIENYQIDSAKVKVVPHGANLECNRNIDDIKNLVKSRPSNLCKLLFIGVDWYRKGGNVALEVAKELNNSGLPTELTLVGCEPITDNQLPSFVKSLGFIDKSKPEGNELLNKLLAESHFFILPSRAECYGHVFCEANSFGVPCLATNVGGIPTVVRDNLNGKTFGLDANISDYCNYIVSIMSNYGEYERLALSSFNEYETRLNWAVAGKTVRKLLRELI